MPQVLSAQWIGIGGLELTLRQAQGERCRWFGLKMRILEAFVHRRFAAFGETNLEGEAIA